MKYKEALDELVAQSEGWSFPYKQKLQELVDRATPIKVHRIEDTGECCCPVCFLDVSHGFNYFCPNCGQALDWSENV